MNKKIFATLATLFLSGCPTTEEAPDTPTILELEMREQRPVSIDKKEDKQGS
jgi:hypothetical protein